MEERLKAPPLRRGGRVSTRAGADADLPVPKRRSRTGPAANLVLHAHSVAWTPSSACFATGQAPSAWAHSGFDRASSGGLTLKKHKNLWRPAFRQRSRVAAAVRIRMEAVVRRPF